MSDTSREGSVRLAHEQIRVIYIYSLLAFLSLSIFGLLHILVEHNPFLGVLEIAGGLAALLIMIGLRLTGNVVLARNLLLLCIFSMLLIMLFTGGTAGTGVFWFFIFPVSAFFLTNKKAGLVWVSSLFAVVAVSLLLVQFQVITTPYPSITLRQLLISLVVVTIGIYVYQESRENMAQETQQSDIASKEAKIKADIIVENIGEGVVAVDAEGRVILASQVAADLLGWKAKELKGTMFNEEVPMVSETRRKIADEDRPLTRSLKRGETVRADGLFVCKDGRVFPTQITTKAIIIDGKIHGAIETFRDTTAEHEVDRAKSEFVTLASHQLRTPISAISWVGELLIHGDAGKLTPEQLDYVQQIYRSNKRMAALVDAMLTVSSLELRNLSVRPEPVDLAATSREVLEQCFKDLPTTKVLHVKEQYDPELPAVSLDPIFVKMILQNLVANSFKYTPTDGRVTVAIKKKDQAVIIEVSDTGLGIPAKEQSKIFTKLFRAQNIRHKDTDGTGLGLYIVKAAAEYIGGRVTFTSEENKGTTFTVYLPLEDDTQTKDGDTQSDESVNNAASQSAGKDEKVHAGV